MMKSILCLLGLVAITSAHIYFKDSNFETCCAQLGVGSTCQKYCDFQKTDDEIVKAFKSGDCSFEKDASPMYQCLNDKKDNRACCEKEGVTGICLDLCDGSKAHTFGPDHLACEADGAKVRQCIKPYHG